MKFTCTPHVAFKDKQLNASYIDVLQSMEEFRSAKEEVTREIAALEEIDGIADNIEQAISSIEEFGMTVENMSVLNAGGSLEDLMNEKISIEGLQSMSEKSLESLENRALESLSETAGKIWDAFVEGIKKVWEAIKRFFVSLWDRIKSIFSGDKDFSKKAKEAYSELHKNPEAEKKVDKAVSEFNFSEHTMKRFTEVQSLQEKALEDITVSFDASKGSATYKGSGWFEYGQVKKFIDYIDALNKANEEKLASVGGPIEYMLSKTSEQIRKWKGITINEDVIRKTFVELLNECEKLPSMKDKLSQVTGGVLECKSIEVDFHGAQNLIKSGAKLSDLDKLTLPNVKFDIVLHCKEGNLGQLGWTKEKLLEVYDYLIEKMSTNSMTASQIDRMCKEINDVIAKIKVDTKSDDQEMHNDLVKLRQFLKTHSDLGQKYIQHIGHLNARMITLRKQIKMIPAFILRHIDAGAELTKGSERKRK